MVSTWWLQSPALRAAAWLVFLLWSKLAQWITPKASPAIFSKREKSNGAGSMNAATSARWANTIAPQSSKAFRDSPARSSGAAAKSLRGCNIPSPVYLDDHRAQQAAVWPRWAVWVIVKDPASPGLIQAVYVRRAPTAAGAQASIVADMRTRGLVVLRVNQILPAYSDQVFLGGVG